MLDSQGGFQARELLEALESTQQGSYIWDAQSDKLSWLCDAALAVRIPEFSECQTGEALRMLLHGDDIQRRQTWLQKSEPKRYFQGLYQLNCRGKTYWIEERIVCLSRDENECRHIGFLRNVTRERKREDQLIYLACFDELTGLLNRARLRSKLAKHLAMAVSDHKSFCFAYIGLDNISGINNTLGYDVADEALVAVGERIMQLLSDSEMIGRVASAKFGIILNDPGTDEFLSRLNEIRALIRDRVIETSVGPVTVTVSIGATILPRDARTTNDALAIAEETLTAAKECGPDSVRFSKLDDRSLVTRRKNLSIAESIIGALRENRICLAYQPVVLAEDPSRTVFYECLVRLIDRSGALVGASVFMPVAEKMGLVRLIDRRVLEIAFDTLASCSKTRLSINLSPQSANDESWIKTFRQLTASPEGQLRAERLIIEVTENTAILNAARTASTLNELREVGCTIALDDFGAGYTSFHHFKDLKLDIVKIDGTYVRGVCNSGENQLFIRTLSALAQNFDMMVVAEMVEDAVSGELLRRLGVDCFQGFYYGTPSLLLPGKEVQALPVQQGRAHQESNPRNHA